MSDKSLLVSSSDVNFFDATSEARLSSPSKVWAAVHLFLREEARAPGNARC